MSPTDLIAQTRRPLTAVLLASTIMLLSACGKNSRPDTPVARTAVPSVQLANRFLTEGNTAQAAQVYAQLAETESNPALKLEYLQLASELYFDSELYEQGRRTFASLQPMLSADTLTQRSQILIAYNSLASGQQAQALTQLPAVRSVTDQLLRVRLLELQSRAFQASGESTMALKARILLESNLTTDNAITLNRTKIATMLAALDINALRTMAQTPGGSIYRGWLEYSALARRQGSLSAEQFAQRSNAWRARFPDHPAATINPATTEPNNQFAAIATDQVALLLPLTGRFSEVGDAIKTGFIAARFEDGATGSTNIKVYDTASDTGTAIQQYERATAEGASIVIGPLDKSAVINLTAVNRITVPTLSLNYVGDGLPGHVNLFQFGLLPEDEARDAAQYARQQSYSKALIIASDNPVSQRLANAFEQEFNAAGGRVLASELISTDAYDYSQQLTKILGINSSYSRRRRIETLLGSDVEFEPAIRGDVDVIFMAVNSEQALLLRPQLQFHHAGKVPLLSTSNVFSGTPDADRDGDLTGIKYNDIPWTLSDATNNTRLYQTINQNHAQSIQKLIALGIDAYRLHTQLEQLRVDPGISIAGKTGALSLTEGNRIRRRLEWAEFQEGVPARIADSLPVETTLPPLQGNL